MACKLLTFKLLIFSTLIAILMLSSCRHTNKPERTKKKPSTIKRSQVISLKRPVDDFESRADSISLFDLDLTENSKGDSVGFVSVSDIDALPGNLDSPDDSVTKLVIPNLDNKKPEDTRYLTLTSKYRKRLLTGTGISEADSLFVYDYVNDILLKFAIRSLDAVASLSIYEDASEGAHTARDYQFGFQIDQASLSALSGKYLDKTFVYIGKSDPFARKQMRPVVWEKIDSKKVPNIDLKAQDKAALKGYKFSNAYDFESDGFHYYLQEYSNSEPSTTALRMLVMNAGGEVIINYLDYETESSSPAAISVLNNSKNTLQQWTGYLLKNRPPVLVGFDDISFGCDVLLFVDKSDKYVRLNCDNRH
jgi:hypothetical protein